MKRAIATILITFLCSTAYAQTIADVARRERERRAAAEAAGAAATTTITTAKPGVMTTSEAPTAPGPIAAPAPANAKPETITLTARRPTANVDIGAENDDVFKFYDISGTTPAELRAQIARLGPTAADGQRHQGVTNWKLSWKAKSAASGANCTASLDVTLGVEI